MTDLSAFSLEGQTILVTGANSGIGQGIALAIGRAGGNVVAVGRSSMEETEALFRQAAQPSQVFATRKVDLADHKQAQAMLDEVWATEGSIQGLVNNAGMVRRGAAIDFSEEDWDDVLDLNLKTTFFLAQAFARQVVRVPGATGRIVNIASMMSFQGGIRLASYTAAKSGLLGLTRLLANEWASEGINVNAIAPGYIVTNNTAALRADESRHAEILARIPAGRWGAPGDIGDSAVFLLSRASGYMHGAVIAVDGGWLAR